MRIVIDMQGAQTESRFRGIGRYTMSFAQAVVRNRGEHEIILALSNLCAESIDTIRASFDGLLSQDNIRIFNVPTPVLAWVQDNGASSETAELIREAFLASLEPDVIHISSLFEGYLGDAVTSVGRFDSVTPVSVTLYDLIPLQNPDFYLEPHPSFKRDYLCKVEHLKQASLYFAISDFSRSEGIETLGIMNEKIVNISSAIDLHFQQSPVDIVMALESRQTFGITLPFVLYAGGADERKNLPRLIEAFARLPTTIRASHQLLIAGKMSEGNILSLKQVAQSVGLEQDKLLFTGYISDEILIQLYNTCQLYVFPSWHEGFGLPALEAMSCGAPVIASNTTSLPEVIGLDEALFDPFDVAAMSQKIAQALGDDEFRNRLCRHNVKQVTKFSWDETAKRAIGAWETLGLRKVSLANYLERSSAYSRLLGAIINRAGTFTEQNLITLSHCIALNEGAGIERQLLLDVSELCHRDAATGVQRVVRSYLKWLLHSPPLGFRVEPVYAALEGGYRYARCFTLRFLGQGGEQAIDDPVCWQRGDIFFGLDMQHHIQLAKKDMYHQMRCDGVAVKFLVYDLLPIQLPELFWDSSIGKLHESWLAMIASTDGAVCISKATADAFDSWIEKNAISRAPNFRTSWVHIGADINESKPSMGIPENAETTLQSLRCRPSFLCVSTLEPRKQQQQILDSVEQLWSDGLDINLVFVGQQGWGVEKLAERLQNHCELGKRLFWLKGISDEYLGKIYENSTCLVAASVNEGFGLSLIEAACHGIPVLARDIPVFREVAGEHAHYFRGEMATDLAEAIKYWLEKYHNREHPQSTGMQWSTWQQSTENLKAVLFDQNIQRRKLFVDISVLVHSDAKTGIQRVVRSILKEWLTSQPAGYRLEPVYAAEQGYRYARQFTARFMGINDINFIDEPIEYFPGDSFFGLDLNLHVAPENRRFLVDMYRQGVDVRFMVYDLLPIQFPEYWVSQLNIHHAIEEWLTIITDFGGAVCISKSVAHDLDKWINNNKQPLLRRKFDIDWVHLGADIENSVPSIGLPSGAVTTLGQLSINKSFLMVGTLEPRKGHEQVLDAFELLWLSNCNVNLVIVGKQGWLVDNLIERLNKHPELNKRLFWLENVSDEYLAKIYAACSCLIAASYGEGFGLPLIESAQHKLSILARDIPVFREVAGEHASYFSAVTPLELADAVQQWLILSQQGKAPSSENMPWLTWKQSAQQLLQHILP